MKQICLLCLILALLSSSVHGAAKDDDTLLHLLNKSHLVVVAKVLSEISGEQEEDGVTVYSPV